MRVIYEDITFSNNHAKDCLYIITGPLNEVILSHVNSICNSENIISNRLDMVKLIVYEVLNTLRSTDIKIKRIDRMLDIIEDWF